MYADNVAYQRHKSKFVLRLIHRNANMKLQRNLSGNQNTFT